MSEPQAVTVGAHHIGLTVSQLDASARFFVDLLGWTDVRRDPDYPAVFVTDGTIMLTLWGVKAAPPNAFDKNRNVGLHHLALRVNSFQALEAIYTKLIDHGISIEFAPEPLKAGPARHMMCYEPSGIRIEFICAPT